MMARRQPKYRYVRKQTGLKRCGARTGVVKFCTGNATERSALVKHRDGYFFSVMFQSGTENSGILSIRFECFQQFRPDFGAAFRSHPQTIPEDDCDQREGEDDS